MSWRSKKQKVLARSSAEAELKAVAKGVCELPWLKLVLEELKLDWEVPMMLFCDNKLAISIVNNPIQHDCTKHIEVELEGVIICMPFVTSEQQVADALTNSHFRPKFKDVICKLGMIDIFAPT